MSDFGTWGRETKRKHDNMADSTTANCGHAKKKGSLMMLKTYFYALKPGGQCVTL